MTTPLHVSLVASTSSNSRTPPAIKPASKVFTRAFSGHGMTGGADDATGSPLFGNAYKVTTNGSGGSTYVGPPAFTAYDLTGQYLRIRIRVDDPTKINALELYVTTGAGNTFKGSVNQTLVANEAAWITVPRATASGTNSALWSVAGGTPVWTGVTQVQIRIQDKSTGAINMWVEAIEAVAEETAYPNGVFVLCMDDGYAGQITNAVPVLDARGVPVTFFPIIDQLASNSWSTAYLQDCIAKKGWQVGVHAYAKTVHDYTAAPGAIPAATAQADWVAAKSWIRSNLNPAGGGVDLYATNPGSGSPVAEGALMTAMRGSFEAARFNSGFIETQRPADPHKLRSILFTGNTNSQLSTNIDQATAQGGMLILTLHDVLAGSTNGTSNSLPAIAANNLATVLDKVISNRMAIRTLGDALAGR